MITTTIMKRFLFSLLMLLPLAAGASHGSDEELLPPDEAFPFAATVEGDTLKLEWNTHKGYYLYKDKIKLSTDTPGVRIEPPALPTGEVKDDEFFGRLEVYHQPVRATARIVRDNPDIREFTLTARFQGCADIGVCYPPITKTLKLALPAGAVGASAVEKLGALGQSLGATPPAHDPNEPLDPDQAFVFTLDVADPDTLVARWTIAPDYYMYRDKIRIRSTDPAVRIGQLDLPPGEKKQDEFFGEIEVYHGNLEVKVPLIRTRGEAQDVSFEVRYQGCAEKLGICYPPIKKQFLLSLPATTATPAAAVPPPKEAAPLAPEHPVPASEQDRIAQSLASGTTWLVILTFFGFGLLLAFTPCVFPMIPILSSIIVGQGEGITTRRAFTMSLVYVLAMALTYTAAGVIAGLIGENVQAAFQNPWVLVSFALVFVLLALSMFGFYDLQMPAALQSKFTEVSNKQKGGTLTGVAIMGFLSALIVGPCVAAPLAGALIYISQTGDAVLGGTALFALSMGMGAPLIAIGTSAGKLLPKAGPWMDAIKAVFGVLLLAVAIWMLERILPVAVIMFLWGTLFIVSAVYLKALDPLDPQGSGWHKLWKGVGVILLILGTFELIGAFAGARDYMRPLHGIAGGGVMVAGAPAQEQELHFKRIKTVEDLERELKKASAEGRMVMLDFYADWCIYCKDFEKYVFTDPRVIRALDNVVLLQADVTENDDADKALLKKVQVTAPPAILFFDTDGKELREYRLVGSMKADDFLAHVNKVLAAGQRP